jgi:glycosyltransferase involved in cell wall biosynthesis
LAHKISIIIPTFQRPHLLRWGLHSLAQETIPFNFETIVINDGLPDETESICEKYQKKLHIKYIFSGNRNLFGELKWRVPGFATNIAVKQSDGDILVLCCAEMFHLNNTIANMAYPFLISSHYIGIPHGKNDIDGSFLHKLNENDGQYDSASFDRYPDIDIHLPFLMSIGRREYNAIGGYDEDFIGVAGEDNDFVERLIMYGCEFYQTDAKTIHLYHPRNPEVENRSPAWEYNYNLWLSRRGVIYRNKDRVWGRL